MCQRIIAYQRWFIFSQAQTDFICIHINSSVWSKLPYNILDFSLSWRKQGKWNGLKKCSEVYPPLQWGKSLVLCVEAGKNQTEKCSCTISLAPRDKLCLREILCDYQDKLHFEIGLSCFYAFFFFCVHLLSLFPICNQKLNPCFASRIICFLFKFAW